MALNFRVGLHSYASRPKPTTNYSHIKLIIRSITSKPLIKLEETKWETPQGHETELFIYNSFQKNKSKLILQNENLVKWYSCGPTVYDSAHIGHAS